MLTIDKSEINETARPAPASPRPVSPRPNARARRICYSERTKRPTEWLWPAHVPMGRLTLLVGEPGLGKDSVAADLAARVSRGAVWPKAVRPWDG
jgi:transcriptional regulator with AAA-type ATPase domain